MAKVGNSSGACAQARSSTFALVEDKGKASLSDCPSRVIICALSPVCLLGGARQALSFGFFMNTVRPAGEVGEGEGELLIHSTSTGWVTVPGPIGVRQQARQALKKGTC